MKEMISVVIPTFNRVAFLKECIDSVLAQTIPCELIVCDHGSTDSTPELVRSYGDKLIYVRREKDFGPHFCWLDGVLHASNDWIHLQYDDDLIAPSFLEETSKLISDEVGFIFTKYQVFVKDIKDNINYTILPNISDGLYDSKIIEKIIFSNANTPISPGCSLLRKSIILNNTFIGSIPFAKFEYNGVGPDLLYILDAIKQFPKLGYVAKSLAYFRSHENSITINAFDSLEKQLKLKLAYQEAKKLYLLQKFDKRYFISFKIWKIYHLRNLKDYFIKLYKEHGIFSSSKKLLLRTYWLLFKLKENEIVL